MVNRTMPTPSRHYATRGRYSAAIDYGGGGGSIFQKLDRVVTVVTFH